MANKNNSERQVQKIEGIGARGSLAHHVYLRMLNRTESFELRFVGSYTAYLMGAILGGPPSNKNKVTLDINRATDVFYAHTCMSVFYVAECKLWDYLELLDEEGRRLDSDAIACLIKGEHFRRNSREENYCTRCMSALGEDWKDTLEWADKGLADPNRKPHNVTDIKDLTSKNVPSLGESRQHR